MADVVIVMSSSLPITCVGCGRPARWTRRVRVLGTSYGYAPMFGEFAVDNLERMARGPGAIRLPVCGWHRWIVPPAIDAEAAGDRLRLSGVSTEFASALGR